MIVNVDDRCGVPLEFSIKLPESSIIILENIYSTGITHDDRHNTIIIYLVQSP